MQRQEKEETMMKDVRKTYSEYKYLTGNGEYDMRVKGLYNHMICVSSM
jgi:hypothetical protein